MEVPSPTVGPAQVLVAPTHSVISSGTERAVRTLASASLLAKAKARPELVRQVINKARTDGVRSTMQAVQTRLDEDMPLGYSAAGMVIAVGEAVSGLKPGDRVATAGAGHAELQLVASNLSCPVPAGVPLEDAAFATIASIALHGLRLAELGPGATVCVLGLGLLGQIATRLALASGYRVCGIDLRADLTARAEKSGVFALIEEGTTTTEKILEWTRGRGVDAVLVTAATPSSDPIRRSPALCRDRGRIVVVGDIGLELQRTPLYEKEISLVVARSYGPGRYERAYEDWGIDYPPAYVRWTAARNMEAALDLMAAGTLVVSDLVTHRIPVSNALDAYETLGSDKQALAVQLTYPEFVAEAPRSIAVSPRRTGTGGVGLIGAGTFTKVTLMPALREAGFDRLVAVTSQTGLSARHLAERTGIEKVAANADDLINDPEVDTVFVTTPHDSHARLAIAALTAGRHTFCEKPLALTTNELDDVIAAWTASAGNLMVGFNRRHSPSIAQARQALAAAAGPRMLLYRVSAGRLPAKHWYNDRVQGGRMLGEVCHFIDTCMALVDAPVTNVVARSAGRGELQLANDIVVSLRFDDDSLATIVYASGGHPSTPKEHLEVLAGGHTVVVDDYRSVSVDGEATKAGKQDKGHRAELEVFRRMIRLGDRGTAITTSAFATMRTSLAAVASLAEGVAVVPLRDSFE